MEDTQKPAASANTARKPAARKKATVRRPARKKIVEKERHHFGPGDILVVSGAVVDVTGLEEFTEGETVPVWLCGLKVQAMVRFSRPFLELVRTSFAVQFRTEQSHAEWAGRPEALIG